MRLALGAGRGRLVRQLLVESALLALVGGLGGLILTAWGADLLALFSPERLTSPRNDYAQLGEFASPAMDGWVLLFALGVSAAAAILFGLAPALVTSRPDLARGLQTGARQSGPAGARGARQALSALVVLETALSLVLLSGAGLMVKSLARLQSLELGFGPENVLTFGVKPPSTRVRPEEGPALVGRLLDGVRAVPGVLSASVNRCMPFMSTCARTSVRLDDEAPVLPGREPVVGRHYVGGEYFRTLGMASTSTSPSPSMRPMYG